MLQHSNWTVYNCTNVTHLNVQDSASSLSHRRVHTEEANQDDFG